MNSSPKMGSIGGERVALVCPKEDCCTWPEYYDEFSYFSEELVRPGCQPRRYIHPQRAKKAIVLIHGLSDSPFYMTALADYFHNSLSYNVYLPLLHGHGLKKPEAMVGVALSEWKKNVRFAIQRACEDADQVSIGGLSTGGAIALYFGCLEPKVGGDMYLFSAALGLAPGRFGLRGATRLFLLRSPLFYFGQSVENTTSLVAVNPYRYNRIPLASARELAYLIYEIDAYLGGAAGQKLDKRIFAVWSEFDHVIDSSKIMGLKECVEDGNFRFFVIEKAAKVNHACVVLHSPVFSVGSQPGEPPLEEANPHFAEMLSALQQFEAAS